MKSDEEEKSFWTSIPGILTGIAAVVTAVAGLAATLYQLGLIGNPHPDPVHPNATNATPLAKQGFRVVEAILHANPNRYSGPCPVTVKFSGRISVVGGAGEVSYRFLRSDHASAPVRTISFSEPGSQTVSDQWTLGGHNRSYSGWQAIKVFDPSETETNHALFEIQCD